MKLTTTKLIGLLAVLIAIYLGVEFLGGKQKSKSLRTELVNIDPDQVTKLSVKSPTASVIVEKVNDNWQLTLDNGQTVPADQDAIVNAIDALNGIKPSRMATRKKEKWAEYQVDSTGTEVTAYAGDKALSEIILGKFGMTDQRAYHTFVRLQEDDEVYVANNFMSFSVPSEPSAYRLKTLANVNKDSLATIAFTYPGDSSFRMEKLGETWFANDQPLDSAKVVKYLNGLSNISSRKFYQGDDAQLTDAIYQVEFALKDGQNITIEGFVSDQGLVFNSSENTTSFFADSAVFKKSYIGANALK